MNASKPLKRALSALFAGLPILALLVPWREALMSMGDAAPTVRFQAAADLPEAADPPPVVVASPEVARPRADPDPEPEKEPVVGAAPPEAREQASAEEQRRMAERVLLTAELGDIIEKQNAARAKLARVKPGEPDAARRIRRIQDMLALLQENRDITAELLRRLDARDGSP